MNSFVLLHEKGRRYSTSGIVATALLTINTLQRVYSVLNKGVISTLEELL